MSSNKPFVPFTLTADARNPKELERIGVKTILSNIIKEGNSIFDVCVFNAENEHDISTDSMHEGPVSLAFIHEPSECKKFYAFFVTEEEHTLPAFQALPISMLSNFKLIFDFKFNWNYDEEIGYKTVRIILVEMPFSEQRFIAPDDDHTYWTPYFNSNQILYGGISAFLSALQDNRYIIGMDYRTQGSGVNEKISIGFLTEPIERRNQQLLFFSVYFGQKSICERNLESDLNIMHGYEILDSIVLPEFICNHFIASLFHHV